MQLNWSERLTPIQVEQSFAVFLSSFLTNDRANEVELTRYFRQKILPRFTQGHLIHIAQDQGTIIGFALFEKWEEQVYYLAEMAIEPAYQRKGIGKKLIFSLFQKDPSAKKILLVTMKTNLKAQQFYQAIGFLASDFQHPDYPENFVGYEYNQRCYG